MTGSQSFLQFKRTIRLRSNSMLNVNQLGAHTVMFMFIVSENNVIMFSVCMIFPIKIYSLLFSINAPDCVCSTLADIQKSHANVVGVNRFLRLSQRSPPMWNLNIFKLPHFPCRGQRKGQHNDIKSAFFFWKCGSK